MFSFPGCRSSVTAVAALVTSLVVTLPAIASPAEAVLPQAEAVAAQPAATDPETAASIEARRTGRAVEVEALGTETTKVMANPDGSFTADVHVGPSRFRDATGSWRDVDLRLEKRADGTVAPGRTRVGWCCPARPGSAITTWPGSRPGRPPSHWAGAVFCRSRCSTT